MNADIDKETLIYCYRRYTNRQSSKLRASWRSCGLPAKFTVGRALIKNDAKRLGYTLAQGSE